jgi:hypothetical protein
MKISVTTIVAPAAPRESRANSLAMVGRGVGS